MAIWVPSRSQIHLRVSGIKRRDRGSRSISKWSTANSVAVSSDCAKTGRNNGTERALHLYRPHPVYTQRESSHVCHRLTDRCILVPGLRHGKWISLCPSWSTIDHDHISGLWLTRKASARLPVHCNTITHIRVILIRYIPSSRQRTKGLSDEVEVSRSSLPYPAPSWIRGLGRSMDVLVTEENPWCH